MPDVPCSFAAARLPHAPHDWESQPGMDPVRCAGFHPTTRVEIDPNIRSQGNLARVGFEDADGPLQPGQAVEVYESETGLTGTGTVTAINTSDRLAWIATDWTQLRTSDRTETGGATATAQAGGGAAEDGPGDSGPDWVALDQVGHDTPGCDCGHDGMGASWHANDCAWKAGMVAPGGWNPPEPECAHRSWERRRPSGWADDMPPGSPVCTDCGTLLPHTTHETLTTPAPVDPTLREAIAGAILARIKLATVKGPQLFGATGHALAADEYDLADTVLAAIQPALDELADYRNRIGWETTCGEHARLLDASYAETMRAEKAEQILAAVRKIAEPATLYDDVSQDRLARRILAALADAPEPHVDWRDIAAQREDKLGRVRGLVARMHANAWGSIRNWAAELDAALADPADQPDSEGDQ